MAAKSGGKLIFEECCQKTHVGQKFRQNRCISLRFQDKFVFAFNAEIQDGRQKWRENDFVKCRQ